MAKTIFPPISLQQPAQERAPLLAVQSTSLALTTGGAILFGSQIAVLSGRGILQLDFQTSFEFPLVFSMESPGLGTYAWSLSGDPNSDQDGQTAYSTHSILILRNPATGVPVVNGAFVSLIPSLGLQASLVSPEDSPLTPILLEGHNWIFRLSSETGVLDCASLRMLEA